MCVCVGGGGGEGGGAACNYCTIFLSCDFVSLYSSILVQLTKCLISISVHE